MENVEFRFVIVGESHVIVPDTFTEEQIKQHILNSEVTINDRKIKVSTFQITLFNVIPDYGDLMTIAEFMRRVFSDALTENDGSGKWATTTQMSDKVIDFCNIKQPDWATHVVWFNK